MNLVLVFLSQNFSMICCTFYTPPYELLYKHQVKMIRQEMEEPAMKGYHTSDGYMGFVDDRYILFASESDYYDFLND